ncbi:MAG: hypothetical protein ACHP84_12010 [Caulobacterales bacterium]
MTLLSDALTVSCVWLVWWLVLGHRPEPAPALLRASAHRARRGGATPNRTSR